MGHDIAHCPAAINADSEYQPLNGSGQAVEIDTVVYAAADCGITNFGAGRLGLVVKNHIPVIRQFPIGIHAKTAEIINTLSRNTHIDINRLADIHIFSQLIPEATL